MYVKLLPFIIRLERIDLIIIIRRYKIFSENISLRNETLILIKKIND